MNIQLAAAALLAPNCSGNTKLVLAGISLYANEQNRCSVANAEIAQALGCNASTFWRACVALKELGYVKEMEGGDYEVTIPTLQNAMPEPENIAKCNDGDIAKCNAEPENIAKCNDGDIAKCNAEPENIAKCNDGDIAKCNVPPPQNSASLPPAPPITSKATLYTPPIILDSTKPKDILSRTTKAVTNTTTDSLYITDKATTPNQGLPAAVDSCINLDSRQAAFRKEAISNLVTGGLSEAEASRRIDKVWTKFTAKVANLRSQGSTKKRPYYMGMLVSMAREATDYSQKAEEPRDLGSLFAKVAEEFKAEYPDQADKITGSKLIELVPPTTYDGLRALEAGHWAGIVSPLVIVKQRVQPYVFRLVEDARVQSKEQARRDYAKVQMKLYEYLDALRFAHKTGEPESKIKALEEHVTELQAKLDSLAATKEVA